MSWDRQYNTPAKGDNHFHFLINRNTLPSNWCWGLTRDTREWFPFPLGESERWGFEWHFKGHWESCLVLSICSMEQMQIETVLPLLTCQRCGGNHNCNGGGLIWINFTQVSLSNQYWLQYWSHLLMNFGGKGQGCYNCPDSLISQWLFVPSVMVFFWTHYGTE